MLLNERSQGEEFSQIEQAFLFNDKYTDHGFVEPITKDGRLFFLNPSLFFQNPSRTTIYLATDSPPPPKDICVRVQVSGEKNEITGSYPSWEKYTIKEIDSWQLFDPAPLAARRSILDPEEVLDAFTRQIAGESDTVREIATCEALYALSSPPLVEETGGINAAVFGKKYQWNLFKQAMQPIPKEFRRKNAPYYYYISEKEKPSRGNKSEEISCAILRPETTTAQIPLVLDETNARKFPPDYKNEALAIEQTLVRSYLLDSLLLKPDPFVHAEQVILDSVYAMREDCKHRGIASYRQDIGGSIPRMTAAMSRLFHNLDPGAEEVRRVVDLWSTMHYKTIKLVSTPTKIEQMYKLTGTSRKLYVELHEVFGADYRIGKDEIAASVSVDPAEIESALISLEECGMCLVNRQASTVTLLE